MSEIHGKMVALMKDLGHITKERQNNFHGFKFRGVEDALREFGAVIRRHDLMLSWRTENETTKVSEGGYTTNKGKPVFETSLRGVLRLTASDGSFWESSAWGTEIDGEGKSGNKAMAAAFKYAVFMGLSIPVEPGAVDDGDYDGDVQEPGRRDEKPVSTRKQVGWPGPKEMDAMSIDDLRALAQKIASTDGKDSTAYKQCVEIGGKKKASAA